MTFKHLWYFSVVINVNVINVTPLTDKIFSFVGFYISHSDISATEKIKKKIVIRYTVCKFHYN